MAKVGEGDPRWIVEERPDATNVNNWHWKEKDATEWSKNQLKNLLVGLSVTEKSVGSCELKEITKCEGEATTTNRKAKLIIFYDWKLEISWKGCTDGDGDEVTGKIEIPNFSDDTEFSELDISVSTDTSSVEAEILRDILLNVGKQKLLDALSTYISRMKDEYGKDLILPQKTNVTQKSVIKSNQPLGVPQGSDKISIDHSIGEVETLKEDLNFKCLAEDLYRALTVPQMVQAFTQGPVRLEATPGGKFEFFGGNIQGEFIELVENSKIVQKWRNDSWPKGHYSTVTLSINQTKDSCNVKYTQTSVPKRESLRTKEGWHRYYWEPIKRVFGFGASLY